MAQRRVVQSWESSGFLAISCDSGRGMSSATIRSMQMGHEPSLLDDARFLEELAKVEALPREDTSVFPKPVPTVADPVQTTAITDELPPALGPRTNGPHFVLAPPPNRRKSSRRRADRTIVRIGTSASDQQPADVTEPVPAVASASASVDDHSDAPALARGSEKNTEAETSLNAFPSESGRRAAGQTSGRSRVRGPRRGTLHPALAVVGFVLMMSIGAGAAALVFHDRVTQIVALLESPRR
jgi:hypothetical protein